jgi:hypothetical protein
MQAHPATYYISKSLGLDTRTSTQAQSKTTPWAHIPGMQGATSNASSFSPSAGDHLILYGGDTWGNSDLGTEFDFNGSPGNPIYIGVDQTWFNAGVCGASWCRPIWNCGGTSCAGTGNKTSYFVTFTHDVTVDNIEMTGLFNVDGGNDHYFQSYNQNDILENSYLHGWSHGAGTNDTANAVSFGNNSGFASTGSGLFNTIIDGSDTSQDSMQAVSGAPTYLVGNVFQYVSNEFQNNASNIHDNYFGVLVTSYAPGAHENSLQIAGVDNGQTHQFVYNNVITKALCSACGGAVKLWLNQFAVPTGTVSYAFNNLIFNNEPGNLIALGGHTAVDNGVWWFFNNTVECGKDTSTGTCADDSGGTAGMTMTVHFINNHWITSGTTISCTFISCPSPTTNLTQTVSAASSQGYTSTSTFAFAPTSGAGSTVAAGTAETSMCSTVAGLDTAAGTACQKSTGYACVYNTGNHTVSCPADTESSRPSSSAWDIGAYLFGSIIPTFVGASGGNFAHGPH